MAVLAKVMAMRGQVWYVALLVGLMCLVRGGLATIGYADPQWLMEELDLPLVTNLQMPYIIRVWAIRDIVLALLIASAHRNMLPTLLIACITIDAADVLSAHLGYLSGLFDASEAWSLKLTAIAALIPETVALCLLFIGGSQRSSNSETSTAAESAK